MEKLTTLLKKVQDLNIDKKYDEVIELLPIDILEKYNDADLYAEKAAAFGNLKKYPECEIIAQKAIEIDKDCAKGYHVLGIMEYKKNNYIKAEGYFLKAIGLNSEYTGTYIGLAVVYISQKEYEKALKYLLEALKIDSKNPSIYNTLGILYRRIKQFDKAEENYLNAINLEPNFVSSLYNIGLLYFDLSNYYEAKKYFEQSLPLRSDENNFYYKTAISKIEEINKILDNSSYKTITELVSKIKEILLFKGEYVTHYSSISATQYLILKDSPLRLSEGSFLNDTSEGQELFDFLGIFPEAKTKCNEEIFTKRPFIGSFVDISKRNNLTLWRMYGKEDLVEAKGCSVTLNVSEFKQLIKEEIHLMI